MSQSKPITAKDIALIPIIYGALVFLVSPTMFWILTPLWVIALMAWPTYWMVSKLFHAF